MRTKVDRCAVHTLRKFMDIYLQPFHLADPKISPRPLSCEERGEREKGVMLFQKKNGNKKLQQNCSCSGSLNHFRGDFNVSIFT